MADRTPGGPIRQVVILGGGTAGWMTAAALVRALGAACEIVLIELEGGEMEDTGVLAGFESTLPGIRAFNALLGLDEHAVARATRATAKLGTEFVDWSRPGRSYVHPLGEFGGAMEGVAFHHHWLRLATDPATGRLEDYALAAVAGRLGRFARPSDDPGSVLSTMNYALHLDVSAYVQGLRAYAEARGVRTLQGRFGGLKRAGDGLIQALRLQDGREVEGELFIDCSGAAGLLVEKELGVPYQDWREWLPCDRIAWTQAPSPVAPATLTSAAANRGGWRWRVPLQDGAGHANLFASRRVSEDEAAGRLVSRLPDAAPPRVERFRSGRRAHPWTGNCVAIGLSAACAEPLEGTGLHLVQSAVTKLLALFPSRNFAPADEYNRVVGEELDRIRDLLILHYKANRRRGEPLWDACRTMPVPEPLAHKIRMFESRGHVPLYDEETFEETGWVSVLIGQEVLPRRRHPFADRIPEAELRGRLGRMRALIRDAAERMPVGQSFAGRLAGREQAG